MKFHHISYGKQLTANKHKNQSKHRKSASRGRIALAPFAVMAVFAVAAIASPFVLSNNFARADSYDNQINANNQSISTQQSVANQALASAGSYQAAVNQLQSRIDDINNRIIQSNQTIADLNAQISQKEQQITQQSQAVVTTLQNMYYDKQSSSTLNIIMNSNSVSDYVNAQARQTTVQNNLQKSIDTVNMLKRQLAGTKAQVQSRLNDQKAQEQQVAANQAAQQQLLNQSTSDKAAADATIKNLQDQNVQLKAQQLAALRAAAASNGKSSRSVGGSDSYPFGNAPSGFNYNNCYGGNFSFGGTCKWECASYVEWEVYAHTGVNATNSGDAIAWWNTWYNIRGYTPRPNSAVVWRFGGFGHIAWVESVNSPTDVVISQYNADGTGQFSRVEINPQTYMRGTLLGYLYF